MWYLRDVFFGVILAWAQVALLGGDPCRDRGGGAGRGGVGGVENPCPRAPKSKGFIEAYPTNIKSTRNQRISVKWEKSNDKNI